MRFAIASYGHHWLRVCNVDPTILLKRRSYSTNVLSIPPCVDAVLKTRCVKHPKFVRRRSNEVEMMADAGSGLRRSSLDSTIGLERESFCLANA